MAITCESINVFNWDFVQTHNQWCFFRIWNWIFNLININFFSGTYIISKIFEKHFRYLTEPILVRGRKKLQEKKWKLLGGKKGRKEWWGERAACGNRSKMKWPPGGIEREKERDRERKLFNVYCRFFRWIFPRKRRQFSPLRQREKQIPTRVLCVALNKICGTKESGENHSLLWLCENYFPLSISGATSGPLQPRQILVVFAQRSGGKPQK